MSKGHSNSEIARKLNLSLETVKWYNKQLYAKLEVGSRTQAVAKAVEMGIFETPTAGQTRKEFRPAHNLPASITSFIGREKEIQNVQNLASNARLVTITGSGGIGKTRLVIQVATAFAPNFPDGVRWVGLAGLSGGIVSPLAHGSPPLTGQEIGEELVTQAVAKAFRVPESPDLPLRQGVIGYLYDKQILLVLDNCEHLI